MANTKEFENILNECLDRMIKGETIKSCLASYPKYAKELEPLLKTAQEARVTATVKPRDWFRQRAGIEFQEAIHNLPVKKVSEGFKWQLRWVLPVAIVLVLLAGGAGTVAAATNALPDSPLYQVKLAIESVRLAFTFSDQGKAELYTQFVDYRVEEIVKMAEEGDNNQVELTTERMNGQLLAMADLNLSGVNHEERAESFGLMKSNVDINAQPAPVTVPASTIPPSTTTVTPTTTTTAAGEGSPPPVTVTQSMVTQETTSPLSDIDKLRLILIEKMEKNLQILKDQLEKAPEALKPALQKAIEVAEEGYWLAIASLG
jgi:hypothetical protein